MPRVTVQISDDADDWLNAEKKRTGKSKAKLGGECIELIHSEVGHIEEARSDVIQSESDSRLDELEERVAELEARIEGSPMAHERDARADDGQAAGERVSDGPSAVENQNPSERAVSGSEEPAIEDVVDGAYQNRKFREERREIGRVALEWLREQSAPQSGGDFQDALHPEHNVNEQNADTWWRTTARPAVQAAVDAKLVEYREGHHDYRWTG